MTLEKIKKNCGIWEENLNADKEKLEKRKGQEKAIEALEKRGLFILLYGASRAGKSWLLSAYANKRIEDIFNEKNLDYEMDADASKIARRDVQYMTFFDLELQLRSAQTKGTMCEFYQELLAPKLLIVDEMGRGKWSEFTSTFFQNLLIRRYGEKKETWIASNFNGKELAEMFDIALIERLNNGSMVVVENG